MPTSSFDTFFACTILVAAALIGTAFLGSTMQARIIGTEDINKGSYLKAIADHIITNPGTPTNWGSSIGIPADFGLAAITSTNPYELDLDKITRLNSLNNYSLSPADMANTAKLNNIALGITVSQIMTINISQSNNITIGSEVSFTFTISTSIDSKPQSSNLHCYIATDNYIANITSTTPDNGIGHVTVQIPSATTNNTLLIVFARASIDNRITSYAIYNFANQAQESTPSSTDLAPSPLDYTLSFNESSPDLTVQNAYVFSYSYQQIITSIQSNQCSIPKLIDTSPLVIVVRGLNSANYFQEWTAYPQIPLKAGANFNGSEQNIFSYLVTVNGVLYRFDLSLGDVPP